MYMHDIVIATPWYSKIHVDSLVNDVPDRVTVCPGTMLELSMPTTFGLA
jgi:hypothetical protein